MLLCRLGFLVTSMHAQQKKFVQKFYANEANDSICPRYSRKTGAHSYVFISILWVIVYTVCADQPARHKANIFNETRSIIYSLKCKQNKTSLKLNH